MKFLSVKSILTVLALVLIILPGFAYAESVYLGCTVLDFETNSSISFTVKLDNDSGEIIHTEKEGPS